MKDVAWKIRDSDDIIYLCLKDNLVKSYIVGPIQQINKLSKLFDQHKIPHEVEEEAISINGGVETTQINIALHANMAYVFRILCDISERSIPQNLPMATISGEHIVAKRFNIVNRAVELIIAQCEHKNIDISKRQLDIAIR